MSVRSTSSANPQRRGLQRTQWWLECLTFLMLGICIFLQGHFFGTKPCIGNILLVPGIAIILRAPLWGFMCMLVGAWIVIGCGGVTLGLVTVVLTAFAVFLHGPLLPPNLNLSSDADFDSELD